MFYTYEHEYVYVTKDDGQKRVIGICCELSCDSGSNNNKKTSCKEP